MGLPASLQARGMITRLALTVVGVLLMVGPPYALAFTRMSDRFQLEAIAGVELVFLVFGFVLLYLGLKEPKSSG